MRRKTISILLTCLMVTGLVLTGCDENGMPTEEEMNEFSQSIEEFGSYMEDINANMEAFTAGVSEFSDIAEDVTESLDINPEEIESAVDDVTEMVDAAGLDIEDAAAVIEEATIYAGEFGEEIDEVAGILEEIDPDVEKLVTDILTTQGDVQVIAEDLTVIYTNEQLQALIAELEGYIK